MAVTDSDMVFVGYGVVAPEFGWDDYKGVDVRGKTLVMLVGDPPVPDPANPSKLDPKMFKGAAMTYYGRWTYKYEIAAAQGRGRRDHRPRDRTAPAIPLTSCRAVAPRELRLVDARRDLARHAAVDALDDARPREGSCSRPRGLDFDALKARAATREFRPCRSASRRASPSQNTLRTVDSQNVIAQARGQRPGPEATST